VQPDTPPFVYQLRNTGRSYTKSQLKRRLAAQALVVLCMTPEYSESDTHDFVKSCVSFFEIYMSIHKSADLRSDLRAGAVKNVYETHRTDGPYTTGLMSVT